MDIDWSKAPEGATHYDAADSRISSFMKLEGGSWFFWPPASSNPAWTFWRPDTVDVKAMIPRPAAETWNGEGLPPVGTVCEWHPSVHGLVEVTILGRDGEDTWYRVKGEHHSQTCANMAFFRPIKTAEQIAEEERKATLEDLTRVIDEAFRRDIKFSQAVYDAGYRKQVKP